MTRVRTNMHARLVRRAGPWTVVLTVAIEALRSCARACAPQV
jgi:hypothetical protein